jgi:hypothetical protein
MREQLAADESDAGWVHPVERPKAARRVPPARAVRGEAIDILGVYGVAEFSHAGLCEKSWAPRENVGSAR